MKKLISIVIPAYNEEENLDELGRRLQSVFSQLSDDFEVILVDNGSNDKTWLKIQSLNQNDARFKGLQLSRNFTAPGGITAGLHFAKGDAAIIMCADLQDRPEMIPSLIEKWREGYDVVYQIVSERKGIGFFYRISSEIFHWFMNRLTQNSFPRNGSVYRLMTKSAYKAFNQLSETNRYFTGLCNWIGFKSIGLEFPRDERFGGQAKSSFSVVLKIALNGIFSFSYLPLRIMTYFGFAISFSSLIYFLWIVTSIWLEGKKTLPGIATLICLNIFLFGLLFLFLGIMGEYLARIYDEVKLRPNFIVRQKLGIESNAE